MIFESDFFSEPAFRSQFVDKLVHSPDVMPKVVCGVSQVQLLYSRESGTNGADYMQGSRVH